MSTENHNLAVLEAAATPGPWDGVERRTEDPDDPANHHPSCCGACNECVFFCWGYHGRERRAALRDAIEETP